MSRPMQIAGVTGEFSVGSSWSEKTHSFGDFNATVKSTLLAIFGRNKKKQGEQPESDEGQQGGPDAATDHLEDAPDFVPPVQAPSAIPGVLPGRVVIPPPPGEDA